MQKLFLHDNVNKTYWLVSIILKEFINGLKDLPFVQVYRLIKELSV